MQSPRFYIPALLLLLVQVPVWSANVSFNSLGAGPGGEPPRKIVSTTGQNLAQGSLVRVGHFNNAQSNMAILTGNDFSAINALFVPLGEDPVSSDDGTTGPIRVINANGDIGGAITNISAAFMPEGRELYVWVLNTSTASASATEWAIFRDSAWIMPPAVGSLPMVAAQIDSSAEVIRGSLNGATELRLAAIPEPASLAWLGLGMLALFRRRR